MVWKDISEITKKTINIQTRLLENKKNGIKSQKSEIREIEKNSTHPQRKAHKIFLALMKVFMKRLKLKTLLCMFTEKELFLIIVFFLDRENVQFASAATLGD